MMSYVRKYPLTLGDQVLLVPHTLNTCGIKNTWNLQVAMPVWERVVLDLVACEPRFFTTSLSHVCLAGQFFLLLLFNYMCKRGF